MAIDMEAVKRRLAFLNGDAKTSRVQKWKPQIGTYKIRLLEWPDADDGMPFKERWVYYLGENDKSIPPILAPKQFGRPDPIDDFIKKLYSSGKPDDKELAKKMSATLRCHAPVVVRGEEDKGVQVWVFGKGVYKRLLGFLEDEDSQDYMSPTQGIDLKVMISKMPGKTFNDTQVDHTYKRCPLHVNEEVTDKLLKGIPNIDDMYAKKTDKEIKDILERWLAGPPPENTGDGSPRGKAPVDELDSIASEVKVKPPAKEKPKTTSLKKVFDDAFAELEND